MLKQKTMLKPDPVNGRSPALRCWRRRSCRWLRLPYRADRHRPQAACLEPAPRRGAIALSSGSSADVSVRLASNRPSNLRWSIDGRPDGVSAAVACSSARLCTITLTADATRPRGNGTRRYRPALRVGEPGRPHRVTHRTQARRAPRRPRRRPPPQQRRRVRPATDPFRCGRPNL